MVRSIYRRTYGFYELWWDDLRNFGLELEYFVCVTMFDAFLQKFQVTRVCNKLHPNILKHETFTMFLYTYYTFMIE